MCNRPITPHEDVDGMCVVCFACKSSQKVVIDYVFGDGENMRDENGLGRKCSKSPVVWNEEKCECRQML